MRSVGIYGRFIYPLLPIGLKFTNLKDLIGQGGDERIIARSKTNSRKIWGIGSSVACPFLR